MTFTIKKYSKEREWDATIDIKKLPLGASWGDIFDKLFIDKRFVLIEKALRNAINTNPETLYPKPDFLFKTFCMTPFDEVKVVIIGQDPYFNHVYYKDKKCPQAYGLSFSVPHCVEIPSSLQNIYKNLLKYKHIDKNPDHGCLDFWAYQGCLMMNSSLTVIDKNPNCHQNIWNWFTNEIISYISQNSKKIVFVLWGGDAFKKLDLIDLDKHDIIISSHPSGLSASTKFRTFNAFNDQDHFGMINSFLKNKIIWDL